MWGLPIFICMNALISDNWTTGKKSKAQNRSKKDKIIGTYIDFSDF